jgi:hypothetical protein
MEGRERRFESGRKRICARSAFVIGWKPGHLEMRNGIDEAMGFIEDLAGAHRSKRCGTAGNQEPKSSHNLREPRAVPPK